MPFAASGLISLAFRESAQLALFVIIQPAEFLARNPAASFAVLHAPREIFEKSANWPTIIVAFLHTMYAYLHTSGQFRPGGAVKKRLKINR